MSSTIHVVSKEDNTKHAAFTIDLTPLPDLAASSVRVRSQLIALTSANLAYAQLGTIFKWWDAYPVPASAPAPYNDASKWGIIPAWGYSIVLESTISSLPVGTALYGFWPTSTHPVDLHLSPRAGGVLGWYVEGSPARSGLMSLYNVYREMPASAKSQELSVFRSVWSCAWALNAATFGELTLHPFGVPGMPWSAEDADLSNAVVVLISASSKTARAISWMLTRNREKGSGPLGLVQVTSVPEKLAVWESDVAQKTISYSDEFPTDWAKELQAKKVVIIDMGGKEGVLQTVVNGAYDIAGSVTVLRVGGEAKVPPSPAVLEDVFAPDGSKIERVRVNTSPLLDRMLEKMGAEKWASGMDDAWERFSAEGGFGPLDVKHFDGVEGATGIEGAWEGYCQRTHEASGGIVVRL